MKHPRFLVLVLSLAVACSDDPSAVNAAEPRSGSEQAPALTETLDDLGSAAKSKAEELADALRDRLSGVDQHLSELAQRLEESEGVAREKLEAALVQLEEKRRALGAKLEVLGEKGGEKFEAAKRDLERATAELAQDLARALEQFQ